MRKAIELSVVVLASCAALALALAPAFAVAGSNDPYVKRAGDSMFGPLRMNGVGTRNAVLWNGNVPCGSNGAVCNYYDGVNWNLYVAGALRMSVSNSTGQTVLQSGTTNTLDFVSSRAGAAAFATAGTGWLELEGDTQVNVGNSVPTAGRGALNYDDTNTRLRVYENARWNALVSFNPDGGSPNGLDQIWTGTAVPTAVGVRDVSFLVLTQPAFTTQLGFLPQVVGVGAGNVVVGVHDGSAYLCSGNCACTTAVGTSCGVAACAGVRLPAGNTRLRVDTSACTAGSAPVGAATLSYRPVF